MVDMSLWQHSLVCTARGPSYTTTSWWAPALWSHVTCTSLCCRSPHPAPGVEPSSPRSTSETTCRAGPRVTCGHVSPSTGTWPPSPQHQAPATPRADLCSSISGWMFEYKRQKNKVFTKHPILKVDCKLSNSCAWTPIYKIFLKTLIFCDLFLTK